VSDYFTLLYFGVEINEELLLLLLFADKQAEIGLLIDTQTDATERITAPHSQVAIIYLNSL